MNTPFGHKGINEELRGGIENSQSRTLMTFDEKQRLVGAFAWLIQEDKKQNPELYSQNCTVKRCKV